MKTFSFLICFVFFAFVSYCQEIKKGNETIWQNKPGNPALNWEGQVFHLGNGYFGVSVYGGIKQEILNLCEKTFWTGGPDDRTDYNFGIVTTSDSTHINAIRKLTSEGRIFEADKLVSKYLTNDTWQGLGGLSSIGSLILNFDNQDGEIQNYERILNLNNSTLTVKYKINGVNYNREYFCSYPGRVLAIRITSDKPGTLSFDLGLNLMHKSRNPQKIITPSKGLFKIAGNIDDNNRPYRIKIKIDNDGGELSKNDSLLVVKRSNSVIIYYSVATNYMLNPPLFKGADPDQITNDAISNATSSGYKQLKAKHIADYQQLYNRTSLHLENPQSDREALPTNERLGYFINARDEKDQGLKELAFNFGKYILISASRPGTMAAALQGTWNNKYKALWNGTYQLDMNVTQTYMFGNALNLSECQEPIIDYTKMLAQAGTLAAKKFYGTNGWASFVISDLWGGVGMLPPAPFLSGGWLSLICWEQYAFDNNEIYLRNIYPILKGASLFYLENLIEYKDTKRLVLWGTYSAEHSSSPLGITAPNFQDIAFIDETFENTIKASLALNIDPQFRDELAKAKSRLMDYKIGRMGQFQEWIEDMDDPNCHHRHMSHLLSLQPCKQINPYLHPDLINSIKVTLKQRGDDDFVTLSRPDLCNSPLFPTKCKHEDLSFDNYTSQTWSRSARICNWIRALDGDHANKIQNDIFRESTLENMIQYECRAHYGDQPVPETPFFLDGTVLAAGYVTEMVLQSQYGELDLLTALPSSWTTGNIRGIRARGACTLDIDWKDCKLTKASIKSDKGGTFVVRYKQKTTEVNLKAGETVFVDQKLKITR